MPCSAANRNRARARGCSLADCNDAASPMSVASSMPCARTAHTRGAPTVRVPVLSNTTERTEAARSSAWMSRIRMPERAAAPVPATRAVGVASPSAHGQAMTSTAMPATSAGSSPDPVSHQIANVRAAIPTTTGTNTALILSTRRCTGAFRICASSTSATMRASRLSLAAAVVRTRSVAGAAVEAAAGDRITGMPGHRQALAGDHRLVDLGVAVQDHAVDRDPLSGTHDDDVVPAHLVRGEPDLLLAPEHSCLVRLQRHQFPQRPARPATGPGSSHLPARTSVMITAEASK